MCRKRSDRSRVQGERSGEPGREAVTVEKEPGHRVNESH